MREVFQLPADALGQMPQHAEQKQAIPTGEMADGRIVFSPTGAMAELTITNEEYTVPVFTDFPRQNWPC